MGDPAGRLSLGGSGLPGVRATGLPSRASFSWYTYSPSPVRYPYVRALLLEMWREARQRGETPVDAWVGISRDPERSAHYKDFRGKGGFVRATWPEVTELIAAAHVATVRDFGPDRVVGSRPSRRCRRCPTPPVPASCR